LFGRDSRLILRLSVNHIANRLSLREVNTLIKKSSKGELARLSYACSSVKHHPQHSLQDYRTAMATDFHNIFAGIRVRRFEICEDNFVYDLTGGWIGNLFEPRQVRFVERAAGF
jgi:hypothetical protein